MTSLLTIARDHAESTDWFSCGSSEDDDDDLKQYELWRVIKKQVKILRDDMDVSEPDEPNPELNVTFHGQAERLAQGTSAEMTLRGPVPFGKAEHGLMGGCNSKSIPVYSRRLTPEEARATLQKQQTGGEKIWDWGNGSTL
jgi:hypothetical protein